MTLSISVENQMDNVTDRRYSPWTRRRLPGAKLHVHAERRSDSVVLAARPGVHMVVGGPDGHAFECGVGPLLQQQVA